MRSARFRTVAAVVVWIAVLAIGQPQAARTMITFTEDFEDGINDGGWTFGGAFSERIEPDGGNPGAFLRNDFLDTFAAQPRTALGLRTAFHGNYRERAVRFVGIDLAVFRVDSTTQGRPLSVILRDDAGTRDDTSDDCSVYRIGGHPTPAPNGIWQTYRFRVPSEKTTLPAGWAVQGCPGRTADEAWNQVMTGVDQLRFFTGDPELFFIFQVWDIGLDNPTITFEATRPDF